MKKMYLFTAAMLISMTSFAQLGIVGGLTSTSSDISVAATELKTKMISQYHIGLSYKIGLGKVLTLQPGIIYNVKGAAISDLHLSNIDFKTGYVEVPVQLQAGLSLGDASRIYGIVEPFAGCAVSNSIKYEDLKETTWDNVKNRMEYGVGLGVGVELIKRVQINLKYFWNFGGIYGENIDIGDIADQIRSTKCGGISLSAVVMLF